ncbi:TPA: hypothetical protein DDZ86_04345 [Candidatus Dependentiae bacterium]|nr:MAG: Cell shape-determining protein MreC [candidate division TM6 bacterium GW2011_GWF2_43_87]HBL98842.1 hypothetical protein [Candidatus Dependentiae bacterium]
MRRRSLRRILFGGVLIMAVFWLVVATQWWQRRLVAQVVAPFLALQHSVTDQVRAWRLQRLGHDDLVLLLEKTLHERDALLQRVVELEAVVSYGKDCAELDAFRRRYKLKCAVVAQVLLKNLSETTHFFLVDAGESKGIAEDMIALCHNHLIGRVSEVTSSYSKIMLVTDSASRVASICPRTGARGILEGVNDSKRLKLSFVSHYDELKVDDFVVSYGAGLVFPRGFGLGKILSVSPAGIYQEVFVEPLIDLQTVDFCLLVSREAVEASELFKEPVVVAEPVDALAQPLSTSVNPKNSLSNPPVKSEDVRVATPDVVAEKAVALESVTPKTVLTPEVPKEQPVVPAVVEAPSPAVESAPAVLVQGK